MISVIHFRLFGDYGHFGLRYATTSSPTHMIPPRHTIAGILGAILGVDREKVAEVFHPNQCKIGISVNRKLSVMRLPLKLLKIKNRNAKAFHKAKEHNIVPYQILRKPDYTIYFQHNDKYLMQRMSEMLQNHECVYPPALGMANLLADFEWLGELNLQEVETNQEVKIITSFPVDDVNLYPEAGNSVVFERFAHYLDSDRQGYSFHRQMVDVNGKPVSAVIKTINIGKPYKDNEGRIIYLW